MIAIDPGACTGVASFDRGGRLSDCRAYTPEQARGALRQCVLAVTEVVIELPQIYRATKSKGDPNDLLELAVLVGRYAETCERRGATVRLVKPAAWKGQVDKAIHNRRILAALSAEERALVPNLLPASKLHNVIDAIGLGLWLLREKGIR